LKAREAGGGVGTQKTSYGPVTFQKGPEEKRKGRHNHNGGGEKKKNIERQHQHLAQEETVKLFRGGEQRFPGKTKKTA